MNKIICYILAVVAMPLSMRADDVNQSYTRENPDIDTTAVEIHSTYPSYINLKANHIIMNGATDWDGIREILDSVSVYPVNIVHIGDSHLQADMGTAVVRQRLAQQYGNLRGRGLVIPFRLAGTNQPVDYSITSNSTAAVSRLLKTPWSTPMRFTGIGVKPGRVTVDYKITAREPFDAITVYVSGSLPSMVSAISGYDAIPFLSETDQEAGTVTILLAESVTSVDISLHDPGNMTVHGFVLSEGDTGIAYHVIGNNGAAYISYNGVPGFANDISLLEPDLIIVSLGCNEAFGPMSDSDFRASIHKMVTDLRHTCPESTILLTTPAECQRKVTTRTRRKRGRRRTTTTSFAVNQRVGQLRKIILDYAAANHIAVYDWYAVAGPSAPWVADHTLNTDRIHHTLAGYHLQGGLFADALIETLSKK